MLSVRSKMTMMTILMALVLVSCAGEDGSSDAAGKLDLNRDQGSADTAGKLDSGRDSGIDQGLGDSTTQDQALDMGPADAGHDIQPDQPVPAIDAKLPCSASQFPPAKPNQLEWRWIGVMQQALTPCPVAAGKWKTEKLFGSTTAPALSKYCLYEWMDSVTKADLCALPYDGSIPPWTWLARDSMY